MPSDTEQLLRDHGLQVTAQRLAVMRAVAASPHCTAEKAAELAREEIGAISRQAVYDALRALAERRLIRRIQPNGSAALYEQRLGEDHHHVICERCGRCEDVAREHSSQGLAAVSEETGYEIGEAEVIFRGLCPTCRRGAGRSPG